MARSTLFYALALLLAFGAGWQAKEWQRDSIDLVTERAAEKAGSRAAEAATSIASQSARTLENKLEALRNAPPKEIYAELARPVFANDCLSDDYISLFNNATEKAERALSGERDNQMPASASAPRGK